MPLTPQDVQNKRFTVVRFKSGYDEEEVDNFLDEIEEELRRLIAENASLRQAISAGQPAPGQPPPVPAAAPPVPAPARPASHEETGDAALKTLMLAQKTAEDAIAQAHAEAEAIVNSARLKASALEHEAQAAHNSRVAALEDDRKALEAEIVALRTFEREFRTRLRAYLESSINDLDARPSVEPAAPRAEQRPGPASPPSPPPPAAAPPAAPPAAAGAPAFAAGPPPVAAPAPSAPAPGGAPGSGAAPGSGGAGAPAPGAAAPPAAPRGPAAPDAPTPPTAAAPPESAASGAEDARSALAAAAAAAASAVPSGSTPNASGGDEPTAELPRGDDAPAAAATAVPGLAPAAPLRVAPSFVSRPVPVEADEPPSGPPAQA